MNSTADRLASVCALAFVVELVCLSAQAAWQYVLIEPNGETTYSSTPPVDLTYPPPGEPTPMIDISKGETAHGVELASEEIRERALMPRLVIYDDASLMHNRELFSFSASVSDYIGESYGGGSGLPTLDQSKPVHVQGYYRGAGTYVRPHTRSLPRR